MTTRIKLRQFLSPDTIKVGNLYVSIANNATSEDYNFHNVRFGFNLTLSNPSTASSAIQRLHQIGAISERVDKSGGRDRSKPNADPKRSIYNYRDMDESAVCQFIANGIVFRQASARIKAVYDLHPKHIVCVQVSIGDRILSERCNRTSSLSHERFHRILKGFITLGWIEDKGYQRGGKEKIGIPSRFIYTNKFYEEFGSLSHISDVYHDESLAWGHDDVVMVELHFRGFQKAILSDDGEIIGAGKETSKHVKRYDEYLSLRSSKEYAWSEFTKLHRNFKDSEKDESYYDILSKVTAYNQMIAPLETGFTLSEDGETSKFNAARLLRLTAQMSFGSSHNGRMYCDLQNLERGTRKTIQYNGIGFTEYDFKASFIQVILASRGIQMVGDPYLVSGYDSLFEKHASIRRAIIKMSIQMYLNNSSMDTAFNALIKTGNDEGWWKLSLSSNQDASMRSYLKRDFSKLKDLFIAAYPVLSEWFMKSRFYELFFIESEIMRECMHRATTAGILHYSVHDGIGCINSHTDSFDKILEESFQYAMKKMFGVEGINLVYSIDNTTTQEEIEMKEINHDAVTDLLGEYIEGNIPDTVETVTTPIEIVNVEPKIETVTPAKSKCAYLSRNKLQEAVKAETDTTIAVAATEPVEELPEAIEVEAFNEVIEMVKTKKTEIAKPTTEEKLEYKKASKTFSELDVDSFFA